MSKRHFSQYVLAVVLLTLGCPIGDGSDAGRDASTTGDLYLTTSTIGPDLDPDGYAVTIDDDKSLPISVNGTVTIAGLSVGDHEVQITDLADDCNVNGQNPLVVSIAASGIVKTTFAITCSRRTGGQFTITGVSWNCDGMLSEASGSDLWPVTWSDDDNQYTAWGDGNGFQGSTKASWGIAKLEGAPESFVATDIFEDSAASDNGKLASLISVDGVLYGLFNRQNSSKPDYTIISSTDKGLNWTRQTWSFDGDLMPTTFLNFSKDNADARDSYVYAYGGDLSMDHVGLMRVPSARITRKEAWQYFAGFDGRNSPSWSPNEADWQPVFNWNSNSETAATHAAVTYFPGLRKYILTYPTADDVGSWQLFQASEPWGPWRLIAEYTHWCGASDAVTEMLLRYVAPKWISADGSEFWMLFSAPGVWDRFNAIRGTFQLAQR